jgi:hypothetical protein
MARDECSQYVLDGIVADQAQMRANEREIFKRLNELEKRMAQVVVVAIAVSLCFPIVVESLLKKGS